MTVVGTNYIYVNIIFQLHLLLVCCDRWLPQPQLHRLVAFFNFKLLTLLSSDFVEHMCHSVLVNCCLVVPAMVFPGNSACFSGLVTVLNDENLRAAFIIPFIFSQIFSLLLQTLIANQNTTTPKLSHHSTRTS
jgi:hypothetical protein